MIQPEELVVDNFAGGGGASEAIEEALGRPVDIAINHDPEAIAMHAANHPHTRHLCENVWDVDILGVTDGRPVGLAWFSPDCRHFSKAKGGKPLKKKIRGLAWVALKWAKLKKPRVIILENVEEFQTWGPIVNGKPCPKRRGVTFKRWVSSLRNFGYNVEWRELRACDYGAPTIRKRLFIVARRDGQPIVWPEPTHGPALQPYRTAAECIDWSLPCPSIFLSKSQGKKIGVNRPLAEATMRRIARGVKRYVIDAAEPFIVNLTHQGGDRFQSAREPLRTVTGAQRGEKALVFPFLGTYYGANRDGGDRIGSVSEPLRTQSTENRHALVAAFLAQHNTGMVGHDATEPVSTIVEKGCTQAVVSAFLSRQFGKSVGNGAHEPVGTTTAGGGGKTALVTSHIMKMRGSNVGSGANEPLQTISAQGQHHAEVRAFLLKYYGTDQDPNLREPMHTLTTKHRMGLVTVHGEDYVIVDIGMRMLTPRELFRAQGFRESYVIDQGRDVGARQGFLPGSEWIELTKTAQVRMCGNSVSPPPAAALVRAQFAQHAREAAA